MSIVSSLIFYTTLILYIYSSADPEGGTGGPDPLKNHSYQASIQCWANIGPPAKRHLNGVLLAGQWWPIYSDIWILYTLNN